MLTPAGPAPGAGPGGGGWAARLERWAAEARVDQAAAARSREQWLRHQAEEDATVAGVLADLAEAGAPVRITVRSGGIRAGVVRAVGDDVVAVEQQDPPGGLAIVVLAAVTAIRTGAAVRAVTGDRTLASRLRLVDVLAGLAAERESARICTEEGEVLGGEVRRLGRDVVVLRPIGRGGVGGFDPTSGVAYVPLRAITAVEL